MAGTGCRRNWSRWDQCENLMEEWKMYGSFFWGQLMDSGVEEVVGRKVSHWFPPCKVMEMRVGVTSKIYSFTLGTEDCLHPPVFVALSDLRSSQCENLKDQAIRCIVLQSNWNWVLKLEQWSIGLALYPRATSRLRKDYHTDDVRVGLTVVVHEVLPFDKFVMSAFLFTDLRLMRYPVSYLTHPNISAIWKSAIPTY